MASMKTHFYVNYRGRSRNFKKGVGGSTAPSGCRNFKLKKMKFGQIYRGGRRCMTPPPPPPQWSAPAISAVKAKRKLSSKVHKVCQARKIHLKFWSSEDDQFWISGRPHELFGCPEDKDISKNYQNEKT